VEKLDALEPLMMQSLHFVYHCGGSGKPKITTARGGEGLTPLYFTFSVRLVSIAFSELIEIFIKVTEFIKGLVDLPRVLAGRLWCFCKILYTRAS
jgi:hypothetical protein